MLHILAFRSGAQTILYLCGGIDELFANHPSKIKRKRLRNLLFISQPSQFTNSMTIAAF